jgi:nucleoside-diphosphate-sugar epimerase
MADVLVTGSNGFIGCHLIEELLARGHRVAALVRPTSDLAGLAALSGDARRNLSLVTGDVRRPDEFGPELEQAEYVYHLAAVLLASTEAEFVDTNVNGTRRLIEQLERRRHPSFKRLLVTSSQAAAGPSPTPSPIDETRPVAPVSWYGRSKAEVEKLAADAAHRGLPVSIVRPVVVYGEREMDLSRAIFPVVSLRLRPRVGLKSRTVTVVYVKDLVRGMIAVAESAATRGRTYFLANPATNRDSDLTDAAAAAVGKRLLIPVVTPLLLVRLVAVLSEWLRLFTRSRPMTTRDKVRELGAGHWAASPAAAKRDTNWQATVSLAAGMQAAVNDWRARTDAARDLTRFPRRDRAIMTYTLAVAFGVLVESTAWIGRWYAFHPWWLIFVVIFGVFGGVMGTLTFLTARWPAPAQFLAGAAVGIGAELLNALWFHGWEFSDKILALLPRLGVRAVVLGLPAGLLPVILTAVLRGFQQQRRRIG